MFMHLLLSEIIESSKDQETVIQIFMSGFLMNHQPKEDEDQSKLDTFVKGMSNFVLGKFYLRVKR
jgi:hypothetical protein